MENKLQPHQERLLNEFNELGERIDKLAAFIDSNPIFKTLCEEEKLDMQVQLMNMKGYWDCLRKRCKRQDILQV